jgi:hypothetical protein
VPPVPKLKLAGLAPDQIGHFAKILRRQLAADHEVDLVGGEVDRPA